MHCFLFDGDLEMRIRDGKWQPAESSVGVEGRR